jgi:hypothetical protein
MTSKKTSEERFERVEFDLFQSIENIDRKNYDYYSSLTEEQRKKFVPYMITHWISAVKGKKELEAYYLISTNLTVNKHLFNEHVQNHPELQWLMLCAASPGIGKQFHQWIPHLSPRISLLKDSVKKKELTEYFGKIYKNSSAADIDEISTVLSEKLNHKQKLASLYTELKLDDIEVLSNFVSKHDIKDYEQDTGS